MLIGLDELPEALRRHVASLRECVTFALGDFVKEHTRLRARYSSRTEASIIHDYMVWNAKDRFPWKLKRNLFLIQIENEFRAKLKKLDGSWHTRRIPTQLSLRFEKQLPLQGRLFDDLDFEHVFLGYQRDGAEILKSKVWLVCPDGPRHFKWIAELTADEAAGSVEFAVAMPGDTDDATGRRIKPKKSADGEAGEPAAGSKE